MRARFVFLALCLCAAPSTPRADPGERFQIIGRADEVEVIARGTTAAEAARLSANRERLELPLAGTAPRAKRSSDDGTVRRVEIRGDATRVLSIKLRHERDRVAVIAGAASFIQIGDDLHVVIPRAPATSPAVDPAPVAVTIDDDDIELEPAAAAGTTGAATATAPAPAALPSPATLASPTAPATALGAGHSSPTSTRWWLVFGGVVLVSVGLTAVIRRHRRPAPAVNQLEIIASRSLGGKSRVVWISAGDRELLIAVSPQQIRPLGQWRRSTAPAERGFGRFLDDAVAEAPTPGLARSTSELPRSRPPTASPAVSGLLRLRERIPPVNEAVATGDEDADAQWARDLVAATGGRR